MAPIYTDESAALRGRCSELLQLCEEANARTAEVNAALKKAQFDLAVTQPRLEHWQRRVEYALDLLQPIAEFAQYIDSKWPTHVVAEINNDDGTVSHHLHSDVLLRVRDWYRSLR